MKTEKIQLTIGLIGAGNMGSSILEGLLEKEIVVPRRILVFDKVLERTAALQKKWKISTVAM